MDDLMNLAADLARQHFTSPIEDGKRAYHGCIAAIADMEANESHRLLALADRCDMLALEFLAAAETARMKAGLK
jgi:hypothetical protein